jgi:hypothetical protein
VHVVLQPVPEHAYGEQSIVIPLGAFSVCIPSHEAASLDTHVAFDGLHVNIESQSASPLHDERQPAPGEHAYAPHGTVAVLHCPAPSQA